MILRSFSWEPDMDNIESRASNYWRSKSVHNRDITNAGPLNHLRSDPVTSRCQHAQGELTTHMVKILQCVYMQIFVYCTFCSSLICLFVKSGLSTLSIAKKRFRTLNRCKQDQIDTIIDYVLWLKSISM